MTDFYRLEADELEADVPPLLFETLLSRVEGWGSAGIDELETRPSRLDPETIAKLGCFLAFQLTRGSGARNEIREMRAELFRVQFGEMTDDALRDLIIRNGGEETDEEVEQQKHFLKQIRDREMRAVPQDAALIGLTAAPVEELSRHFLNRAWVLCEAPRVLVTCDEPVVTIGGPGHPRDERAGVATAGVVIFPIGPDALLAMFHSELAARRGMHAAENRLWRDTLDSIEVAEINRELAYAAERWVFETPSKRVAQNLAIPPAPPASVVEEVEAVMPNGKTERLIHTYKPTRWSRAPKAQWPVARWWERTR